MLVDGTIVLCVVTYPVFLLSRRTWQRERLSVSMLSICSSVCLSPKCKKTRFSQKLSNLELYGVYWRPIGSRTWAFQRTHYWTPKIQDGFPPSWKSKWFFCWGWSDLDKIWQTGAEWHVDCCDLVEIETRCRIPIWRTFERIPWHVIPEPHCKVQSPGEISVMIVPHCRV